MIRNYLSNNQGVAINTLLAAAWLNMMKMLKWIKAKTINFCRGLLEVLERKTNANTSVWSIRPANRFAT